ncbi:MAG TPA: hypothetical protein VMR45_00455 [Patescibacteria group bacterium]|nr:hypothetical protein [Patescibacteria group bacterium]
MIGRNRQQRYGRYRPLKSKRSVRVRASIFVVLMLAGYAIYALRPITYAVQISLTPPDSGRAQITWPAAGQAALSIEGQGTVAVSPKEHQASIASITKMITALAVLDKKPLKAGQQGGVMKFTANDVAICQRVVAQDGVAIGVQPGQSMTERQALEAMLLRSANNIAISLGNWAFGSEKAYKDYTNDMLKRLGFKQTHVAEASGLDAGTVSTPSELLKLGEMAMKSSVIKEITAKSETTIPGFGTIRNGSQLLGLDNSVHALKDGLTDEAGSCLLFWINPDSSSAPKTRIYGVVLGQPDFKTVVNSVNSLAERAVPANFSYKKVASGGEKVASYEGGKGLSIAVTTKRDVVVPHWRGKTIALSVSEKGAQPELRVKTAGATQTYALALGKHPKSTVTWRFLHPF